MSAVEIVVVPTGTANLASVRAAFERLGAAVRIASHPGEVAEASRVVLPGVGSFGEVAPVLLAGGTGEAVRTRIAAGRPTLAICLGLQLLAASSDEAPGTAGLGVFGGTVRRLPEGVRVPQMGWNRVIADDECRLLAPGTAYFANSYALAEAPLGWACAWFCHGGRFLAAAEKGPVVACQFHPELSGSYGQAFLLRWLGKAGAGPGASGDREALGDGTRRESPRLLPRIIPCLDVSAGRVVKGIRFAGLRDAGDPAELAAAYAEQGADELVILDVSATPQGRGHALETVRRVRSVVGIPVTAGGGVRTAEDAAALLGAGADKVAVNTAVVRRPALLGEMAERFGRQCTVLALDARRAGSRWEVVVRSGTEDTGLDAVDWARSASRAGAGEILLTSWDRDGTREGYDLELLAAVCRAVEIPVIASGGAHTPVHMAEALGTGAAAVLAASIFHDGDATVAGLKADLRRYGVEVRS